MSPLPHPVPKGPGRVEFITLISAIMMIVAFSIDSMLPALPAISQSLGVGDEAQRPLVISAFLLGFAVGQLFVGTLSDRYGRRGLMLWSLFGFAIASFAAALAPSFDHLLLARAVQGVFAAGARVIVTSTVRDRFAGRDMAQVMSLAGMIFMAAPILAPTMGQTILFFGPWRWIFGALCLIGLATWTWVLFRLPETLAEENRTPIEKQAVLAAARTVLTDRMSVGYSLATAMLSCALFGFLMSVQQIFEFTFKRPDLLPMGFAIMSIGMAAASLTNAAIVKRFGMRLIGHSALFFFTLVAAIHLALSLAGYESLPLFIALQMLMMIGFSLVGGNFSAMAMENMGRVAGMASSLQGSLANLLGTICGTLIGQSFNGTTVPLYTGFTIAGLVALTAVYVTEGGRFFVARHATPRSGG
ncbi:MAG: multidrug effflux MFS transporter [Sphingomonadaceae bacterium]|jgi:DHA1 family bicyclomycin/chloramphenicol resistance-like MFS transporter